MVPAPTARRRTALLTCLLALPAGGAAVLATFADLHWSLDLLAHFPLHCLLVLMPAALVLAAVRSWRLAAACALLASLPAARLWPLWSGPRPGGAATQEAGAGTWAEPPLLVAAVNLSFVNERVAELADWAAAAGPRVLALSEVTPAAWGALAGLRARYAHAHAEPRPGCFGIALLSELPIDAARTLPLGQDWSPAIAAVLRAPAGPLGVLAVHAPPPGGGRRSAERDRALAALPRLLAELPPDRIVLGDLNATPWSAPFRSLLAATGLADSNAGAGYQGTWPSWLPGLLRIPIDHVLVGGDVAVLRRELGPDFGSDHLPVLAALRLPAPQRPPRPENGGSAWESNPPGAAPGDPPQVLKTRPNTSSDALPGRAR